MTKYLFLDIDGVINSERSFLKYSKQWTEAPQSFRDEVERFMETEMEEINASGFRYGKLHLARAKSVEMFGIGVEGGTKPDSTAVANINKLCKAIPGLRVIISSTWRVGSTLEELQEIFKLWGMDIPEKIFGQTADSFDRPRSDEILEWLIAQGLDCKSMLQECDIAILDDLDDMGALNPCLVQTDPGVGFDAADLNKLIRLFNHDHNGIQ
jgi:hypothetical protein